MSLSDSSSPSCCILTVSASLDQALSFTHRIREHSQAGGNLAPLTNDETREPTPLGELVRVPWTITNKYYSAEVHFAAHTVHGLTPNLVRGVPAVLFIWAKGEPYRALVERLAQDLEGYEPEVCLAVRVNAESTPPSGVEEEEEGEIDEFLSSHGFEYVYATEDDTTEPQFSDGVPNFPRVIDALSTIMWPSMQAKSSRVSDSSRMAPRERGMFNWVQASGDMSRDEDATELSQWLDAETKDPWRTSAVCDSPKETEMGFEDDESGKALEMGFEDDFTVFVTGSDEIRADSAGGELDMDRLLLPDDYKALGSEFGSDDEEMPSREEVSSTSTWLFGGIEGPDDLSGVVSRLREMKGEIARISKEEERRKAAARVALGVVYGL